jgi:nitrite reductase/ring-hydroxylating ferredoxin subunit
MRSAYGRQTPPPDYELTCVEPGSPMGELLRRYWQPVCTSEELGDLPKKVKLLCEELVVFRDKQGRVGALEPHCSHRGASLEWGRVEEEGLRCCYHGWLYDTQGQCIDMPCETEEFRRRMDVWHLGASATSSWTTLAGRCSAEESLTGRAARRPAPVHVGPSSDVPESRNRWFADSLLEGDGFELPVPSRALALFRRRPLCLA